MFSTERAERNKLRHIVLKAREDDIISKEEAGFVVTLTERFRIDIEKKTKELNLLQGEISQLNNNEQIIVNVIENLIKAAQRDRARRETAARLREARDVEDKRKADRASRIAEEQGDSVDDTEEEIHQKFMKPETE